MTITADVVFFAASLGFAAGVIFTVLGIAACCRAADARIMYQGYRGSTDRVRPPPPPAPPDPPWSCK